MDSNDEMVDALVRHGLIETRRVEAAFRNVDRAKFVPEKFEDKAYEDYPLTLDTGSTISAPHMVAKNTELLAPTEDDRVLEIGSGSGYQLAILSELADEVVGVEIIKDLAERSRDALSGRKNVKVLIGNGFEPVQGRFDRILCSCAVEDLEKPKKYLRENGIIVAPVAQDGYQLLKRYRNGKVEDHGAVSFVPFVETY